MSFCRSHLKAKLKSCRQIRCHETLKSLTLAKQSWFINCFLFLKLCFSANGSFFKQSLSRGRFVLIYQPPEGFTNRRTLLLQLSPFFISELCVALNFVNNFGFPFKPFKLYSSLKHEGYLVTGSGFKLKLLIERPELHSHVTFFAEDPEGKREILLDGKPRISKQVVSDCDKFLNVSVTAGQG